ncbi:hypothetical protein [Pedobacter ureilyticus]|uniref:Uncharacterized protein n=1 Tax=Pedobacter ureilyticus TaxID=1393051 RepID=A0ABW9J1V6_9SPHI|nr:hypothetical protein [Pedobacter helvus]
MEDPKTDLIDETKVNLWQKFGLAVLAILATSLAWWLLPKFTNSKDETIKKQQESIERLKSTVEYYRKNKDFADSTLRVENKELKMENKDLRRENDSIRDLRFNDNTKGLERVISIIQNGKSAVVIKPKKR